MPARTDHDRRDAQHAARATIAIAMGRYIRRITEEAYAHIEQVATEAHEDDIDWSQVGAAAAAESLAHYGVAGTATAAIEGTTAAIEAASVADDDTSDVGLRPGNGRRRLRRS